MSRCTCDRYRIVLPNGETTEGERDRDPDCREHGFPTNDWPAGHPLRRHAQEIEYLAWEGGPTHRRLETPRETEERLYQESLAGPSPKRRAPLKKRGSRCDA